MSNDKLYLRHAGGRVASPLEGRPWAMECTHDYQAVEDKFDDIERHYLRCRNCETSFHWAGEQRNRSKSWWTEQRKEAARQFSKKPHKLVGVSSSSICDQCRDMYRGKDHTCVPENERVKHGPDSGCKCRACRP